MGINAEYMGEMEVVEEVDLEEEAVAADRKYLAPPHQRSNAFLYLKQTAFLFLSSTAQIFLLRSALRALNKSALMFRLLNLKENAKQSPPQTADLSPPKSASPHRRPSAAQSPKVCVCGSRRPPARPPLRLWM